MRRLLPLTAVATAVLALSACGGGGDDPVEGTTVPTVATQGSGPAPAEQITKLKRCLGGEQVTRVDVFEPTYDVARSQGGGGFAVMLGEGEAAKQVEFLVFPDEAAAQVGMRDAQNRLIELQQTEPEQYAQIAATAMQVLANVLEIVPTGAPSPEVATTIATCIQQSSAT